MVERRVSSWRLPSLHCRAGSSTGGDDRDHHVAMNQQHIKVMSLARLLDKHSARYSAWRWLTAAVLVHLVVSIVHGAAHSEAHVPLSREIGRASCRERV